MNEVKKKKQNQERTKNDTGHDVANTKQKNLQKQNETCLKRCLLR